MLKIILKLKLNAFKIEAFFLKFVINSLSPIGALSQDPICIIHEIYFSVLIVL